MTNALSRLIGLWLLVILAACSAFCQTAERGPTIAIINSGGYAKLISYAQITVCSYNSQLLCSTKVPIYSDPALSHLITQPLQADGNGNYFYFTTAGTYLEQVCAPVGQCYIYTIYLLASNGGGLSSFTSGNLNPLFTTALGNSPTTNPALTFSLDSAASNTVFGNCTGASAPPSFCSVTGAMLPNPSATTLGGVESYVAVAHQWINQISTSGVPSSTQPAFTDISGVASSAQIPAATTSALGGVIPDGTIITDSSGNITVAKGSSSAFGVLECGSGTSCSGGVITVTGTGGTVTGVSSGNLSPLFTVSIATPTTTPAFSFTLSNAAANTVFGNFTGSPAAPTFSAAPVFSAANLTNFPTFNQNTTGTSGGLSGSPAITVSNVTDSSLTPGDCVQAGTAGILITTGTACGSSGGGITALTGDVVASGSGSVLATVEGINGTLLSGLATGILKNTTSTGVPSIAISDTDYGYPARPVVHADDPQYATTCVVNSAYNGYPLNCAFATAVAASSTTQGVNVVMGSHNYTLVAALTEPAPSVNKQPLISLYGQGHAATTITMGTDIHAGGSCVLQFQDATVGYNYGVATLQGFTILPNSNAVCDMNLVALESSRITDVSPQSTVYGGSAYVVNIGDTNTVSSLPVGGTYQLVFDQGEMDSYNASTQAVFAVNVNGGGTGIPTVSITTAGAGYNSNATLYATGYGSGVNPCSSMGTISYTLSGGGFATVTMSGFSGCVSPMWVNATNANSVNYGYQCINMTDSTVKDLVVGAGNLAQFYMGSHCGGNTWIHLHPEGALLPVGILEAGGNNNFWGTEFDTQGHYGMVFDVSSGTKGDTVYGSTHYWNTSTAYGSSDYYIESTNYASVTLSGDLCQNTNSSANGYHHLIVGAGPVPLYSGETGSGTLPTFFSESNTLSCDGSNLLRPVTAASFNVGTQNSSQQVGITFAGGRGYVAYDSTGTSPFIVGSGSGHSLLFKSGVSEFTNTFVGGFDNSGNFGVGNSTTITSDSFYVNSSGGVFASNVTDSALTSGDCVQAGASGVLTTTGSACGSGSSGISGLTAGYIPLAGSATTITSNSPCDFGVTTSGVITCTDPLAINSSGNGLTAAEGTAPSGVASSDVLWPDSTYHGWKMNNNNGGAVNVAGSLSGTTGSIGGSSVSAGACATGTATVTGVASTMSIIATPSNTAGPGAQFFIQAYMSASNTVTVNVCTDLAAGGTPTATTYNVRAIQ